MKVIQNIKNTCKITALVSFIIGTILVILFAITRTYTPIVTIGIFYVYIAVIINLLIFISVLLSAFYFWKYRLELFYHCGLLLMNIPIAIAYFIIVLKLIGL
ncbi:hypothetical protein [uncultured Winogradskyella sp.]|uniref:hypothetical protein n=1 Tax=uncultured Winogradskyella sp. TaxID=395353 RepID=UPI002636AE08|nr:hypothetical protein [uncultured Winogradskyella sp.]